MRLILTLLVCTVVFVRVDRADEPISATMLYTEEPKHILISAATPFAQSKVAIVPSKVVAEPPLNAHPVLWELADIQGKGWQHKDKAYLERWVSQRNMNLKGVQ